MLSKKTPKGSTVNVQDTHESCGAKDASSHAYVYAGLHHTFVDTQGSLTPLTNEQLALELDIVTNVRQTRQSECSSS